MSAPLDAVALASLLASRLCHDLVNPVGALSAGLEVLEDEQDPEMRAEAQKLITLSTRKSIAMLTFCRLAFGAGGAYGEEIDLDEGKDVLKGLYEHVKPDLVWQLPEQRIVPKNYCKAVLNIAMVIADCVPRGGTVTVAGDMGEVVVAAEGPRAKLKDELQKALIGHSGDLTPKMTPAFLAALLVHKAGGRITPELEGEERVTITATFPQYT